MTLISGKHLCRILITLNAIALFWIVGAPKMYINEFHFHEARLPQYYELTEVYIPREDMTFRSVEGENIRVPAGSRIYRKINYIEFVRAQIDAAMDKAAEPVMEDFYEIRVGEKGAKLDVAIPRNSTETYHSMFYRLPEQTIYICKIIAYDTEKRNRK